MSIKFDAVSYDIPHPHSHTYSLRNAISESQSIFQFFLRCRFHVNFFFRNPVVTGTEPSDLCVTLESRSRQDLGSDTDWFEIWDSSVIWSAELAWDTIQYDGETWSSDKETISQNLVSYLQLLWFRGSTTEKCSQVAWIDLSGWQRLKPSAPSHRHNWILLKFLLHFTRTSGRNQTFCI